MFMYGIKFTCSVFVLFILFFGEWKIGKFVVTDNKLVKETLIIIMLVALNNSIIHGLGWVK